MIERKIRRLNWYASKNDAQPLKSPMYTVMRSSCAFRVTREWVSDTKWYGGTTRTVCATAAAAAALCEHNRRPLPSMNYYLRGCPTGLEGQSVPGGHTCNIHPPPLVPREREKQKQFSHSTHKFVWIYELTTTLLTNTNIFPRHPEFLLRFVSKAKIKKKQFKFTNCRTIIK